MIDLSGVWKLRDESGEIGLSIELPGDVHSALQKAGLIPDPFRAQQELDVQWVGRRTWILEREFSLADNLNPVSAAFPERWILAIDTVDCVGEILINDVSVWSGTNVFIPVRVDISATDAPLRSGTNQIRVILRSAEELARERADSLPYPVPHTIYPVQSMHRNLVRKPQCHAGWDWGPALMVAGVYGTMELRRERGLSIRSVRGVPRVGPGLDANSAAGPAGGPAAWHLPVYIELDGAIPESVTDLAGVTVRLLAPDGTECARGTPVEAVHVGLLHSEITLQDPELWWPAGYGAQPLYTVEVTLGDGGAAEPSAGGTVASANSDATDSANSAAASTAAVATFRTAFRTIQVVNEQDAHGRSLFFRVNGRDLWAKGANWIPVDAFPARQTDDRYRELLHAAVDANMNMLRVWGGGQYERDIFYDLCDELGILVWQDFMFSCSLYPSEEWFLEEVRQEVRHQVRRLVSHPSIALWCGNNENVGALGWFPESLANPGRYLIDYDRLTSGVIAKEVRALDDTRIFWPSSPAAGEGDFSDNWHDDSAGDMHYWSVWHEGKPFSAYQEVTPRFCSEFGFQSFPSLHGIAQFTGPEHYNPTAPDLEHHQRHPRGNTVVTETMTRYFRFPFDFENFLYLSQVQQALAIRTAVDFWRSRRPVSMGALYWQLNDLWPVVSWSSIEYDGRWKLLHHEARRFFAPLRVICQVNRDHLETWVVNDTAVTRTGTVAIRWYDWCGTVLKETLLPATAVPDGATAIERFALSDAPCDRNEAFVVAQWQSPETSEPLVPVERGWTFLTDPKRCELQQPEVTQELVTSRKDPDAVVTTVCRLRSSRAPAFWLTLNSPDPAVRFGDAGILLLPGETADVPVTRTDGRTPADTEAETIHRRHLRSTY